MNHFHLYLNEVCRCVVSSARVAVTATLMSSIGTFVPVRSHVKASSKAGSPAMTFFPLVTRTPLREFTVGRADPSFVLAWQQYHPVPWYGADLYLASTDGVSLRATPQLVATEVG